MLNKYRLWKRLISPMNLLIDEVLSSHSSISFKAAALILFSLWLFIRLFNPHITQRLFLFVICMWHYRVPSSAFTINTHAWITENHWFVDYGPFLGFHWLLFRQQRSWSDFAFKYFYTVVVLSRHNAISTA